MYQRLHVALSDQFCSFAAVVTSTTDTDLLACFIDDLHNVIFLEFTFDGTDTYQQKACCAVTG